MRVGLLCLSLAFAVACQGPAGDADGSDSEVPARRVEIGAGPFVYGATEEQFANFLAGQLVNYPGMLDNLRSNHVIPPQQLNLGSFYIDEFEVTNTRFASFVAATGYAPDDDKDYLRTWDSGSPPDWAVEFPVTWIAIEDAVAYCGWAGGRLPTEEEWEKAARGASGQLFPWGDDVAAENTNASTDQLEPAGNRGEDRSPFGVYDMGGNANELTSSLSPDGKWLITRGGSYLTNLRATVSFQRVLSMKPGLRKQQVGFRCAYDEPAATDNASGQPD